MKYMKLVGIGIVLLSVLLLGHNATAKTKDQLIIVNKTDNTLSFFDDGKLVKLFDVATGRDDTYTPEGTFTIVNKIKNRPYYTGNIPGGHPDNPLGDRWLGLDARGTYGTTYAIHGNNDESSIGKYISAGCIRMKNDEIRWLFEIVEKGAPVIILHSTKSHVEIALDHGYMLEPEYTIVINDTKLEEIQPIINKNGRLLVPLRGVFEHLGATVQWLPLEKEAVVTNQDTAIRLSVDRQQATIRGEEIHLETAPLIVTNKTLVPLRVISEALGAEVVYEPTNQTVFINTK